MDEADALAVEWAVLALDGDRDPLRDDAGRLRLSFTRIDTFARCPMRFRLQYVEQLPGRPAPALSFGSSIHAVLEWLLDRKHPELPDLDATLAALKEHWDSSGYAEVTREEQLAAYAHARDVIARFHARVAAAPLRLPVATEAWFELPFPDEVVVVGSIDRIDVDDDGALHVIDYKTNRRPRDRAQVASSLQLGLYALATQHLYGQLPASVALDFVVAGVTVRVPIADVDLAAVPRAVADAAAGIRAGRDEPRPSRLCDWCDHRRACPAWEGEGDDVLARALLEAEALRRSVARDVRRLRTLERALARHDEGAPGG